MLPHKAFRMLLIGGREDAGAGVLDGGCAAVVNVERGMHSDARMTMFAVVPVVEFGAE